MPQRIFHLCLTLALAFCLLAPAAEAKENPEAVRKAAEAGDAAAQTRLGLAYKWGELGLKVDDREAVAWYRKAAEQGEPNGQAQLCSMYDAGRGVDKDEAKAREWCGKAAKALPGLAAKGDVLALFNLGWMYEDGEGVPKDEKEAVAWYRKAAEQGHALAQFNLGVCYENGRGVPKDEKQAVAWYRKAADQGHADAQSNLGNMYADGRGVPQDDKQAVAWYRKAAEQGDAIAQSNLGFMYDKGRGVPQDDKQAVAWYRKAAEQGDAGAQFNLGVCYENGRGVPQDDKQAAAWYRKAAEAGDADAMYNMGRLCEEGLGLPLNRKEAAAWYEKALERLDENAELKLKAAMGLHRLRGSVIFRRYRAESVAQPLSPHVLVDPGGTMVPADNADLQIVIDYPVDGDPKEAAAVRKAVDRFLDESWILDHLDLRPGEAEPDNLQARLDALADEFAELPMNVVGLDVTYDLRIEALHQNRKTVTFSMIDAMESVPAGYVSVRKSDGGIVWSRELFVLPGTQSPEAEAKAEGLSDPAFFAADALQRSLFVGATAEGLQIGVRNREPALASWADVAPYLSPMGRELYAEHLPETAKEATGPALPDFRRVEKTIGVKRGKGAEQSAAEVKSEVEWPEGGEPKATAALRKSVDALLAECAAGEGITEVELRLLYRDPRLVTYRCEARKPGEPANVPFAVTISAADGRRIGLADLAKVTEEEWRELVRNPGAEAAACPGPAQTDVVFLYDEMVFIDPRPQQEGETGSCLDRLPYTALDPYLTPAGKALLGR